MNVLRFGCMAAPITAKVVWEGAEWDVSFRILGAPEEDQVLAEAAAGHDDGRNLRECMYRLMRAIHAICDEEIPLKTPAERRRWVFGDGTEAWPGFLEPFVWQLADGYDRAKAALVYARDKIAADPLRPLQPTDPSGAG